MVIRKQLTILIGTIIFASAIGACSPSAPKLNQQGNGLFAEEAYLDALQAYEAAQVKSPELAEPYYNAANAFYRQGDYQQALSELHKALSYADQESLRASGFFNMGNSSFNQQELESAVSAYTQALLVNPDDMEAKYNLELALQEQSQPQSQENQEDGSDSGSDQDQSENQDQQQEGASEDDQQQNQQERESDKSDPQEQEDQSDSNSQDPSDQNQEDQSQDDSNSDESDDGEDQDQSADQSEDQSNQTGDQEGGNQVPSAQIPQPGQRMTTEQAKQLLAAIAQNTQTLQEKIGQILFVQAPPPMQDW